MGLVNSGDKNLSVNEAPDSCHPSPGDPVRTQYIASAAEERNLETIIAMEAFN